jgi:hypothetical protein
MHESEPGASTNLLLCCRGHLDPPCRRPSFARHPGLAGALATIRSVASASAESGSLRPGERDRCSWCEAVARLGRGAAPADFSFPVADVAAPAPATPRKGSSGSAGADDAYGDEGMTRVDADGRALCREAVGEFRAVVRK